MAIGTVAGTGDGELVEEESTAVGVTQLLVEFDDSMSDASGDSDPADVTNPSNYRADRAGPDGAVQTVGCGAPVGDDGEVPFAAASYSASTMTTALSLPAAWRCRRRATACRFARRSRMTPARRSRASPETSRSRRPIGFSNPNFDHDLAGWVATEPSPQGEDFWTSSDFGSLGPHFRLGRDRDRLRRGRRLDALSECFRLPPNPVEASGWADVESSVAGAPVVGARIDYFAGAGCAGAVVGSALSPPVAGDTAGLRTYTRLTRSSPPAAALSVLVSIEVEGGAAAAFAARLDDLFYGSTPALFTDGFEGSDATA